MKLKVSMLEIKTASNGNEYLSLVLRNEQEALGATTKEVIFDPNIIAQYKQALSVVNNEWTKLPPEYLTFSLALFYQHVFPKPMYRKWSTDGTHQTQGGVEVPHKAGEIVKDSNGNPKLYYGCTVLVKRHFDEELKTLGMPASECLGWEPGWSPMERIANVIGRQFVTPTEINTATPEAPDPAVAPAPQAGVQQPGVQQPAPQARQGAPAPTAGVAPQANVPY